MTGPLDLAVIGNGRIAALVNTHGQIVWWCFPRFDSDAVFCRLIAGDEEKGFSDVVLDRQVGVSSVYERNTATVVTELTAEDGAKVRITDFAPRMRNFARLLRPPQLMRIIEPVAGMPRITIRVRPTQYYGNPMKRRVAGSSHVTYGEPALIRLTTDAPLSYIQQETPFALTRPLHLVFGPDEPFTGDIASTVRDFYQRTNGYWKEWVRYLSIAYEWQEATIRAAITLKLCNFEETGGIVAALTTSLPEAPHSGRNWDYRYCWLRDAYFVVRALNAIGATRTMEEYITYILSIAGNEETLKPVYGIVPNDDLTEWTAPDLKGFEGHGPVRVGNAAVDQVQHDAYGSVILSAVPMFFDRRLPNPGDETLFRLIEKMARQCANLALEPDAGIWEFRGRKRLHTHSAAMCWAGLSRTGAIAARLGLAERATYWHGQADSIGETLLRRVWNEKRRAFTAAEGIDDMDASVLLLPDLGLIEPDDPRFASTVAAIEHDLVRGRHVMRYAAEDDFGLPETEFLVCRFWLIDALAALGRREEARERYADALSLRNNYGLLAEDIHPQTGALWGNFPQTYSMAGIILSAMRLSQSWEDRYWRASS
ncbi:MAG: glucoamylase [Alphaproteobacteria bacterium 64-11]|nr:glycoside hydrolase family 15 protein [Alphaproteobacteria bacterium]OJU13865.1 MAG: glucoamylase [Alphaproteobacteria bacterium 64-11]